MSSAGRAPTLFCIQPAMPNVGNGLIAHARDIVLRRAFDGAATLVPIPAVPVAGLGGLTARQVYEINRIADGVVVGGGNLFENGQIVVDQGALAALAKPMAWIGVSHGRLFGRDGGLQARTDSCSPATLTALAAKTGTRLVRDQASAGLLAEAGVDDIVIGGCPTLFLEPGDPAERRRGPTLLSIRHPSRMCVAPELQWRVAETVRGLIAALRAEGAEDLRLLCHDHIDLEFAAAFPEAPVVYETEIGRLVALLRSAALSVSFRLHAFLPCFAFGTPGIHVSYDERGRSMLETLGMADWDVPMQTTADVVGAVVDRVRRIGAFDAARTAAQPRVVAMHDATMSGLAGFATSVRRSAV